MQGVNVEKRTNSDALIQMGSQKPKPSADAKNAFRDAVKKTMAGREETRTQDQQKPDQEIPGEENNVKPADQPVQEEKKIADSEGLSGEAEKDLTPTELAAAQMGILVAKMTETMPTIVTLSTGAQQEPETASQLMATQPATQQAPGTEVKGTISQPMQPDGQGKNQTQNAAGKTESTPASQEKQSAANQQSNAAHISVKAEKAEPAMQAQQQVKATEGKPAGTEAKQTERANEGKPELAAFAKPEMTVNTDKVYVKVGDGATVNQQFASDISEKIFTKMSEGKQQFDIELLPQNLGKINIRLIIEGGRAEIIMQCANPKTQQLVAANAEIIRTIVENGTGMQTAVNTKEDAQETNYNDFDGRGEQNKQEQREQKQQWTEAEANLFVQQLKFGLLDAEQQAQQI